MVKSISTADIVFAFNRKFASEEFKLLNKMGQGSQVNLEAKVSFLSFPQSNSLIYILHVPPVIPSLTIHIVFCHKVHFYYMYDCLYDTVIVPQSIFYTIHLVSFSVYMYSEDKISRAWRKTVVTKISISLPRLITSP